MSELQKIKAVHDSSQLIGEFLDWLLNGHGYYLCETHDDTFYPTHKHIEDILAEYFKIDLKKAESERRKILDELQAKANADEQP